MYSSIQCINTDYTCMCVQDVINKILKLHDTNRGGAVEGCCGVVL